MGRTAEGKERMARAHLLLLGDCERRFAWARALRRRSLEAAYRREGELMSLLGEPVPTEEGSYYTVEGTRIQAMRAEKKGEYLKAADQFEQVFLGCMQPGVNFTRAAAYVTVPSHLGKLRAVGLAKAGKFDEAKREASAALAGWPGNLDVAIGLVPVLEKAGRKKDADAVYRSALATQEALLKAHPDSPLIHNQLAWLAACCRRDLEKAHEWAKKAVAAAPKTPAYMDTLAEVLFQLGKKDDAIAAQKKAIALDPKRKYFKLQLRRIEAGDPKAPLPYEDDEDDE
jgi:tetratricopeptide (TPR) repeat protein